MIPQISDMARVVERLEKLEKQNRGLKQIGALTLVLAAAVLLMGQLLPTQSVEAQTPATRTVEANEFVLKDTDGNVRARLVSTGDSAGLVFYDASRAPRVLLQTSSRGVYLTLVGENATQIVLSAGPEEAELSLFTLNRTAPNRTALKLSATSGGSNLMEANEFILRDDRTNRMGARLSQGELGPKLEFLDLDEQPRVVLDGDWTTPGLRLLDANDHEVASLSLICLATCNPMLNLWGPGQKHNVSAIAIEGGSSLSVGSDAPETKVSLWSSEGESSLEVVDRQGWKTTIGTTDLITPRTGETHKTSAASVVMFDKDKKVLWQAP